ncbi:hypothetical protein ACJ72_08636 [Emergomyces africanus]|uniref:Uncharacterized protein n=1 Tax=Emergomyces africanus TaxID=1955775 RepID=A0A1B7NJM6_9EURO|nr:hypothetical protein ACJ72_08636 [Emergomyces africanus]
MICKYYNYVFNLEILDFIKESQETLITSSLMQTAENIISKLKKTHE